MCPKCLPMKRTNFSISLINDLVARAVSTDEIESASKPEDPKWIDMARITPLWAIPIHRRAAQGHGFTFQGHCADSAVDGQYHHSVHAGWLRTAPHIRCPRVEDGADLSAMAVTTNCLRYRPGYRVLEC